MKFEDDGVFAAAARPPGGWSSVARMIGDVVFKKKVERSAAGRRRTETLARTEGLKGRNRVGCGLFSSVCELEELPRATREQLGVPVLLSV